MQHELLLKCCIRVCRDRAWLLVWGEPAHAQDLHTRPGCWLHSSCMLPLIGMPKRWWCASCVVSGVAASLVFLPLAGTAVLGCALGWLCGGRAVVGLLQAWRLWVLVPNATD